MLILFQWSMITIHFQSWLSCPFYRHYVFWIPDICIFPLFIAKPHWLQTMIDGALSIEENLFWECKANGKPKPSYSWLKNGDNLMAEVCMEPWQPPALSMQSVHPPLHNPVMDPIWGTCPTDTSHQHLHHSVPWFRLSEQLMGLKFSLSKTSAKKSDLS